MATLQTELAQARATLTELTLNLDEMLRNALTEIPDEDFSYADEFNDEPHPC